MKKIFLDNETMQILANLRNKQNAEDVQGEMQMQKLAESLKEQGAFEMSEEKEETVIMDEMVQSMIETYLKSDHRMILEFQKENHIEKIGYYFIDDMILQLNAYKEGGEFLWIPSLKLLNGALAELIFDQEINCENEGFAGDFEEYCTEENFKEQLMKEVTEEKYRCILEMQTEDAPQLWMKGMTSEGVESFLYVVFIEECAFYYQQESKKLTYGCADRVEIVNIMGSWMKEKHRELIIQMQEEA